MSTYSGNGDDLVAAVVSQFDWIYEHETYKEMWSVGNNCQKRGVEPIYVTDMHWNSDKDQFGHIVGPNYGMDYWLGNSRYLNGCHIRNFYLNTHGAQVQVFDDSYQNTVNFADTMAYATDSWDPMPDTTDAFTDLNITQDSLHVIQFSVCYCMGSSEHPSSGIARALGCRDDLMGSTFIGWVDEFKPFGFANGKGWVLGFWYYLCKDDSVSVAQAIDHLNDTSNPLWWNTIYHRLRLYTDLESLVTWLDE